jgi:hypothetical protein
MTPKPGLTRPTDVDLLGRGGIGVLVSAAFCVGTIGAVTAQTFEEGVTRLTSLLINEVACAGAETALVGVFPFDEALLPLTSQNAFRLYEGFLGAVIESAPPCVRFIDGRGAFVTLNYLGQTGTLRESGQQQRAQIQQSLASATYMLDGTVLESGGEFEAVFRLTALASGVAIGRVSFPVPERFRTTACADGALPIETAVRRMSEAFLQRTGPLGQLMATGGRYAQTDIVTDAGAYLEDTFLAELSHASENVLSGAALRVQRNSVAEAPAEPGSYTLSLRYWPCEGDAAARLSITLRSADGRDVTEARNISLATLPSGLGLRPRTAPAFSGDLTVSPLLATVGTELSLLAAPPAFCNPFFFNIAPSGKLTPIPIDFFRALDLGGGRVRYEISPQWDFGLMVQEDDEVGLNHLGYLCQPEQVRNMSDLQRLLVELLELRASVDHGVIEVPGLSPAQFRLSGFEIFY